MVTISTLSWLQHAWNSFSFAEETDTTSYDCNAALDTERECNWLASSTNTWTRVFCWKEEKADAKADADAAGAIEEDAAADAPSPAAAAVLPPRS
jgi:hypothetical protein